jgi:hypothetical protein
MLLVLAIILLAGYIAIGMSIALAQTGVIVNGQGTATISWQRPTENTNGSPLPIEDIAGYTVYWGTDPDNIANGSTFEISNGAVTTSMLDLALEGPTTIHFAMTATHVNGQESALSNIASKIFELEIIDERDPNPPELIDVEISITCETDTAGVSCAFTVQ